jgi:hypothetical protein
MAKAPGFDLEKAHAYFGPHCFNATWDLIRKEGRSEMESREMIDLAHASFWHWSLREDCTRRHRSIGYWLLARVHALTGGAAAARKYGELSLEFANESGPFYQGFAHEALARAEMAGGNWAEMDKHLRIAKAFAEEVAKPEEAAWLRENLSSISRREKG